MTSKIDVKIDQIANISNDKMRQAMLTLHNEDKTIKFKVKVDWKEMSFNLMIFANEAWQTQVLEEDLNKLAKERNQITSDYYTTLQQYLSNVDINVSFNLIYLQNEKNEVDDINEEAKFIINKKSGNRVLLFFVSTLKKIDFHESIYKMLDDLMEKHNELYNYVKLLQKEKDDMEKEKNIYQDKLIEFTERKSKWEQEMYSNFLLLLNEKKKRIRFLTNILKGKNINPNELPMEEELKSPLQKRNKKSDLIEKISESESSNYSDTDGNESDYSERDQMEQQEPVPSTSRHGLSLEEPGDGTNHLLVPKRTKEIENKEVIVLKSAPEGDKMDVDENEIENEVENEVLTPQLELSTQELYDCL